MPTRYSQEKKTEELTFCSSFEVWFAPFFFLNIRSVEHFGSAPLSVCPVLHPRQPLWLRSCCHLLSALLTLRIGTRPSHCNLSLLQSWHWGGYSGHFAHFFSSPSFSLPPLSTHSSFGAQMEPLQAKGSFSCAPYLFAERNLPQGKERRKISMNISAVIGVQQSKQTDTERSRVAKLNQRSMKLVSTVKHDKRDCISTHCKHIYAHHVYYICMWKWIRTGHTSPEEVTSSHYKAQLFAVCGHHLFLVTMTFDAASGRIHVGVTDLLICSSTATLWFRTTQHQWIIASYHTGNY